MGIPFKALRKLSKDYGLSHVIVFATDYNVPGQNTKQHVVTYGHNKEACSQAADFGNKLKLAMGWPESLEAQPSSVKQLQAENQRLKDRIAELEGQKQHAAV